MHSATKIFVSDRPGHLRAVAWRPWPGTRGPSSVEGAVSGVALGDVDSARIVVEGCGVSRVVGLRGGRFVLDGLQPGAYRIELRLERLVIARRLQLPAGHHFVTFTIRGAASPRHRRAA